MWLGVDLGFTVGCTWSCGSVPGVELAVGSVRWGSGLGGVNGWRRGLAWGRSLPGSYAEGWHPLVPSEGGGCQVSRWKRKEEASVLMEVKKQVLEGA